MSPAYSMVLKNERLRTPASILIALGFTYASVMPYQSVIAINELGLTSGTYSLLLFASALVNVGASLMFGAISDGAVDRRLLIMQLCLLGTIGFGAVYLIQTPLIFILCTMTLIPLCNSANPLLFAAVRAEVRDLDRGTSAAVTSIVRAGFAGAFAVAPGLVGLWLSASGSMMSVYAIACIASSTSLLLYLFAGSRRSREARPEGSGQGLLRSLAVILRREVIVAVLIISALNALVRVNNIVTPLIITGFSKGSVADVGLNSGLVALLEIPFMLFWGNLQRKIRTAHVLGLGAGIYCAYLALLSFVTAPYQIYAIIIINACGGAAILSVSITYLQDLIADRPGLGSSLISITTCVSAGISGLIFAVGSSLPSYSAIALIAAGMGLLAVGGLVGLEAMKKSP